MVNGRKHIWRLTESQVVNEAWWYVEKAVLMRKRGIYWFQNRNERRLIIGDVASDIPFCFSLWGGNPLNYNLLQIGIGLSAVHINWAVQSW